MVGKLEALLAQAKLLDRRYIKLNQGFLHSGEILEDIEYRWKKMKTLYGQLTRAGVACSE